MADLFHQNKSAPVNKKKGFYTNRVPKMQEVRGIFVWRGSELWRLLNYSRLEFEIKKHKAVDVLIQAYPMPPPLPCKSNLTGRYCGGDTPLTCCVGWRSSWQGPPLIPWGEPPQYTFKRWFCNLYVPLVWPTVLSSLMVFILRSSVCSAKLSVISNA